MDGGNVASVVVKRKAAVPRVAGMGAPGFPLGSKKRALGNLGSLRGSLGLGRSSAKKPAAAKGTAAGKATGKAKGKAEVGGVAGDFAKARFASFFAR